MSKKWNWFLGITIGILLAAVAVFLALWIKTKVKSKSEEFSCYSCFSSSGPFPGAPPVSSQDASCLAPGINLDSDLLRRCPLTLGDKYLCGLLEIKGQQNATTEIAATIRTCLPDFGEAFDGGGEWECTFGTLGEVGNKPNKEYWSILQLYLKVYNLNEDLSVTACKCTGKECNSAPLSKSSLVTVVLIVLLLVFHKFQIL